MADGSSSRQCTICLNPILDDTSRGKAELVCGHFFHLDCIGSEFNYRGTMRCPNCRVTEEGEWRLPEKRRRVESHFGHHAMGNASSYYREEQGSQHNRNTRGTSQDPLSADALFRGFGHTQNSSALHESIYEPVVLQHRPDIAPRRFYSTGSYRQINSPSPAVRAMFARRRNIIGGVEDPSIHQTNNEAIPLLELSSPTVASEGDVAHVSQDDSHEIQDEHIDAT